MQINAAMEIMLKQLPGYRIMGSIEYNGLYIFMAYSDDEVEGDMDPFYSVDKQTGAFDGFSIITDGDTGEILQRFKESRNESPITPRSPRHEVGGS